MTYNNNYVGQTCKFLKTRFSKHYSRIEKPGKISNFLYRHFKQINHSPSNISIQPVEKIFMMVIPLKDIGLFSAMN